MDFFNDLSTDFNYDYAMVPQYQTILKRTLSAQFNAFTRVFALRFDLRFPVSMVYQDSSVISRFLASFKSHLVTWDKYRRSQHPIGFSFVWCREKNSSQNWHYHVVFFFNKDAIHALGQCELGLKNTYNRILSAWASAIRVTPREAVGLVHICKNGSYWLDQRAPDFPSQLRLAMDSFNYLAKSTTKDINDGCRNIGSSHKPFM